MRKRLGLLLAVLTVLLVPMAAQATGGTQMVTDCGTDTDGNRLYGNGGTCSGFDQPDSDGNPAPVRTGGTVPPVVPTEPVTGVAPTSASATASTATLDSTTPATVQAAQTVPVGDPLLAAFGRLLAD